MDPDSSTIYPALTAFLLLLVLSGLFSAAEAAFTGINDSQTQRRAAEGDKKARHIMGSYPQAHGIHLHGAYRFHPLRHAGTCRPQLVPDRPVP